MLAEKFSFFSLQVFGSFHKKQQFSVFDKPKIYYQMNDTKSLNEQLKQFVMQILAKSRTLLELQFFSIDYRLFKCNRNDIFTNYPPRFAFNATITNPNMYKIIDILLL